MSNTNFFYAKISCPREVDELNFYNLLKKLSEGILRNHTLFNIPNNLHLAKKGDVIILHIGGDSSNKSRYLKQNILPKYDNYKNGIHAVGLIENIRKDEKEVDVKIIGLKSPISKSDLYYFPQFINNLGGSTKGTPNQAGLYELDKPIGLSLIDYLNLNNLLPSKVEELNNLNSENQLYDIASKAFQAKFSLKKTTNNFIEKLPKKSAEQINNKPLISIKDKFIDWINKEDNYKKSYDGLVTKVVLDFWNKAYFNNLLFLINTENIDKSISQIENLILNSVNQEWINYSQATSKGAPMAVLGKNNYLKFLNEISNEIKSNNSSLSKLLTPQFFKAENFQKSCKNSGLIYKQELITRYIASLATKPFVLLSGLSGSGKTKLAQAFAQWIAENKTQYCIVPVGADWTNREPLLGYVNALSPAEYILPENGALKLILNANRNSEKPYFLILDEMNLSHVERYFADFLSVMESKEAFKLHDDLENEKSGIPNSLSWPQNLFVVGTVNIDETTYMFSPKVLDRANVIEFRVQENEIAQFLEEAEDITSIEGLGAGMGVSFVDLAKEKANRTNLKNLNSELVNFFRELQPLGAEFGYRTAFEIQTLFSKIDSVNPDYINLENDKIDIAIMQKLLPKLHGSRRKLIETLELLAQKCLKEEKDRIFNEKGESLILPETVKYKLSFEKISRMYKNVIDNGFTSYAEA